MVYKYIVSKSYDKFLIRKKITLYRVFQVYLTSAIILGLFIIFDLYFFLNNYYDIMLKVKV